MRKYTRLLIVMIFAVSCKDYDISLPITYNLVKEIKAYDLDNNGNSSDIRIEFKVENNHNVSEYRVIVLPADLTNTFEVGNALALPGTSYLSIEPESFNNEYSFRRLPSNLLDAIGVQINNDIEYAVAVLVIGTDSQYLSNFSKTFTLKNQGVYVGEYKGILSSQFIRNSTGLRESVNRVIISKLSFSEGKYNGILKMPNCLDNFCDLRISFTVIDDNISNTNLSQATTCYDAALNGTDYCKAKYIGSGTIIDQILLKLILSGEDCVGIGDHNIVLSRL